MSWPFFGLVCRNSQGWSWDWVVNLFWCLVASLPPQGSEACARSWEDHSRCWVGCAVSCVGDAREVHISVDYPPFRKHCAREKNYWGSIFRGIAWNCHNRLREITLGELFSGLLRILVVALWFLTVFVACFQELICAMAILSLRQNILQKNYFWLDCAKFA